MTKDQARMFKTLLDAHELGQKLTPRMLGNARRMLAAALAQPTPIETAAPGAQ